MDPFSKIGARLLVILLFKYARLMRIKNKDERDSFKSIQRSIIHNVLVTFMTSFQNSVFICCIIKNTKQNRSPMIFIN